MAAFALKWCIVPSLLKSQLMCGQCLFDAVWCVCSTCTYATQGVMRLFSRRDANDESGVTDVLHLGSQWECWWWQGQ